MERHVSAVGRGIEGPGLGDYSGKDDLHGYGYFYETFLRTHGVIETFFFYQVVTPVAYKRGQQSYAISGSKNFKGENTQLIRLLSTPQQLLPRSPSWSSNNGEERFERKRGVSLGASL